jgi:hypothetical protein
MIRLSLISSTPCCLILKYGEKSKLHAQFWDFLQQVQCTVVPQRQQDILLYPLLLPTALFVQSHIFHVHCLTGVSFPLLHSTEHQLKSTLSFRHGCANRKSKIRNVYCWNFFWKCRPTAGRSLQFGINTDHRQIWKLWMQLNFMCWKLRCETRRLRMTNLRYSNSELNWCGYLTDGLFWRH